jgi:murein DD-endopeptidase MepM/ murein hydrolase activator NlpD
MYLRGAVLALAGIALASCSNSQRFDSNPFASNTRSAPAQETTGSVAPRPMTTARVEQQPLPAPSKPATVAVSGSGIANGAQGLGAYRPSVQPQAEITGSVTSRRDVPVAPPKPAGGWTWDGGSPVTVGAGESAEMIARKHGVPLSALLETNGMANAAAVKPGQRLVIPRYVSSSAPLPPVAQAKAEPHPAAAESVHIVQPGESLTGIARHYHVALSALAKANHIEPYAKVSMGDRIAIPGGKIADAPQAAVPQLTQPRTVPAEKVAAAPAETARVATPVPPTTETVVKTAEPAGGVPSFRWPVKGRIIAGFGPAPDGVQNDGINLAVPEGTPIKAADDGVVAYAGNELKGYGNLVLVRHSNGFVSAYANASTLLVKRGDTIKRGQVIANAGQTGNVTSPQLHFEIRKGSTPVDPTKYLGGV